MGSGGGSMGSGGGSMGSGTQKRDVSIALMMHL